VRADRLENGNEAASYNNPLNPTVNTRLLSALAGAYQNCNVRCSSVRVCDWSLRDRLSEDRTLRLREIFGKRVRHAGGWSKLQNTAPHDTHTMFPVMCMQETRNTGKFQGTTGTQVGRSYWTGSEINWMSCRTQLGKGRVKCSVLFTRLRTIFQQKDFRQNERLSTLQDTRVSVNIRSVRTSASYVAANIRSVSTSASHVTANIRSVSSSASHVPWTSSIIPSHNRHNFAITLLL
jgi:hypothetical protein